MYQKRTNTLKVEIEKGKIMIDRCDKDILAKEKEKKQLTAQVNFLMGKVTQLEELRNEAVAKQKEEPKEEPKEEEVKEKVKKK